MSAAFIGSCVGLSLGVAYLAAGMGQAAADQDRAEQFAEAADGGRSAPALRGTLDSTQAAVVRANLSAGSSAPVADPDAARVAKARPSRARELECLTQAVYFEARGESARGQAAVATVIMNRVKSPSFPKTVCGVVYQGSGRRHGCQFSFACDGMVERVVEASAWGRARKVAARTLSGAVLRDVGSATHFHTTAVAPAWGPRMLRVAQVGLHVFYRFNPHGVRRPAAEPDDAPVFAGAPLAVSPELRIANALAGPAVAVAAPAAEAVKTAAQAAPLQPAVAAQAPEAKPAPRIDVPAPSAQAPVAKLDAPTAPQDS